MRKILDEAKTFPYTPDMKQKLTAIDLDGVERTIDEIAIRHNLTRRAIEFRLVNTDDGKRRLRPAYKTGRKPKQQKEGL